MTIRMLIDATHEEETRVAIVHGNRVEEFDYESSAKKQIKGNIYLAKITRVEPSLQAAFVDYGGNRHGFLAFSEIHPDYYQIPVSDREELIAEEAAAYAALLEEEEELAEKKAKRKPRRKAKADSGNEADAQSDSEDTPEDDNADAPAEASGEEATDNSANEEVQIEAEPTAINEIAMEDASESEAGSTTLAEKVSEPKAITEKVLPVTDAPSADDAPAEKIAAELEDIAEDDETDDEPEITGSHVIDEQEAEEKLRIKIAKGLRRRYKIQEVIKKNQIVLVQVVKEERGNKGAALTTYLSLPGRYCVLMPNTLHGGGVSRKIANVGERKSLKKILADLDMPSGIACIIRTAGHNRTKSEIKRDFDYLIRTWEGIRERTLTSVAPVLINEEGDLIKRSIRDLYTREIDEILVEGEKGYKTARSFMRLLMPSHARKVKHYTDRPPLLHRYQVENQLDSMYSPTVQLKSGGYIVINPTEALVSIDVNSGKATKEHNIEETARKTNLEAAEEVARQLRLRDMAGLVVIDFIDMEQRSNNRAVEQKLKECLKSDRARIQVGKISSFGLLEMSRQRLRAGVLESSTRTCPHCEGSGVIRSVETQVLHILRALEEEGIRGRNNRLTIHLPEQTAIYMLNNKRAKLVDLEQQYNFSIEVVIDTSLTESSYKLELPASDARKPGNQVAAKQGKAALSDQTDDRTQKKADRDRPASARRNRQRNETRKSKEKTRDKYPEKEDIPETAEEAPEVTQEAAAPEKQESKPRRRRRRSRRSTRHQATETAAENTEEASSATGDVEVKAVEAQDIEAKDVDSKEVEAQVVSGDVTVTETTDAPAPAETEEKPKRRRRTRSREKKVADSSEQAAPGEATATADGEVKDAPVEKTEKKADKKPARRPYPPQTRSRRKSSEAKKSSDAKPEVSATSKDTSETEKSSAQQAPVTPEPQAPATPEPKAPAKEATATETKADEPKKTGPKKTGWWQRTFG